MLLLAPLSVLRLTLPNVDRSHWANIGMNATWSSKQPTIDLGHQIVVNATHFIPKQVAEFPDYYVYGVGGTCERQGYDPPGGWMCSTRGSMHGGTFDDTGNWAGGGYPQVFPSALVLSNTTGEAQTVFPNSSSWDASNATTGTRGIIRAWVNGWFVSMWEIESWDEVASTLKLGRGGFHGGQTAYLDQMLPDGSWARADECCFPNLTANFSNRINPGTMDRVFVENLLSELDEAEEYWVDQQGKTLYFMFNGTGRPPSGNQSKLGAVTLQNLLRVQGEGAEPGAKATPTRVARDITIRGIGFRDAGATYMNPHGMPGGGDWALVRNHDEF